MDITAYADPFEYPDWRWTRVRSLLKAKSEPTPRDDKFIHRGYRFCKDWELCDGSDTATYNLAMTHTDIAKAVGLRNNKSNRKYYLEALCLCQDIDENEIAKYMGETPLMVKYYSKLFFDVRDSFDSPGYICSRVLEPVVLQSVQDCKDPNLAWKLAAMFGGYQVVRACWELGDSPDRVKKFYRNAGMSALFKDFGIGTYFRPVNRFNTEFIAGHILKFTELEIQKAAAIGQRDVSEDRVNMLQDIMKSIKFFVTDPNAPVSAREPRLYELVSRPAPVGDQP